MKTSLSIGEILYKVLTEDEALKGKTTKVFPVVTDKAELPYIAYKLSGLEPQPVKTYANADTVTVEIMCLSADHDECVSLSELVRAALDKRQEEVSGLMMRSCTLKDVNESWQDDAYAMTQTYEIKAQSSAS